MFLILTLLLPTILPLLKIPVQINAVLPSQPVGGMDSFILPDAASAMTIPAVIKSFDYNRLLVWLYLLVTVFFLLKIIISLVSTYRIIRKGSVENNNFPKIVISKDQLPPFSFFPFAVIPEDQYKSGNCTDILDHEFAHIRQGHTFDLLLSEIFIAFQWFNPFVWLIRRSVVLNHEYLADYVSLSRNTSVKEYQYRLLNFQSGLKNISLAHSFNSLLKNRIIMINKKPTRKYAMLKNIIILPAAAFVIYAFSTPEYHYATPPVSQPLAIYQPLGIQQKEVKGTVNKENNKPVEKSVSASKDKGVSIQNPTPIVVIDGVITEKNYVDARKDLGYNMGITNWLNDKDAIVKYGDKGANGAYEITTRKKALEMGLKPPFPRLAPEDFPTFQNKKVKEYSAWVVGQAKYPVEAQTKNAEGWVSVNFNIELDGSISHVVSTSGVVDPLLVNEIIRVVQSSPKWDRPVNNAVDEPFSTSVTMKFKLPDQILDESPFIVVREMPMYQPDGDVGLLNFIKNNTRYPEEAKIKKIEGRVIIRFIVNTAGRAEGISVLKGVDPLLDAEAVRVVSLISGFKPGMQEGKPVNVWYMVPVTFKLTMKETDFKKTSMIDILKFLGTTTGYPQEAKSAQDTGKVFVVLKLGKGGVIKECKALTDKNLINVPLMPEVVIVGYSKPGQNVSTTIKVAGDEHPALKVECERVARLLTVNEIPDWNDKDLEFALDFRFVMKVGFNNPDLRKTLQPK